MADLGIRPWTRADQVRKVKGFLRGELEAARQVRLGLITPPDYMDTPRNRARLYWDWSNRNRDLRLALLDTALRGGPI